MYKHISAERGEARPMPGLGTLVVGERALDIRRPHMDQSGAGRIIGRLQILLPEASELKKIRTSRQLASFVSSRKVNMQTNRQREEWVVKPKGPALETGGKRFHFDL